MSMKDKILTACIALFSGATAIITVVEDKKKDNHIKDLTSRVETLESESIKREKEDK